MKRRERGFTLVEVMIALFVMFLVMNAVSTFMVGVKGRGGVLNQYKQQSRIAQSDVFRLRFKARTCIPIQVLSPISRRSGTSTRPRR